MKQHNKEQRLTKGVFPYAASLEFFILFFAIPSNYLNVFSSHIVIIFNCKTQLFTHIKKKLYLETIRCVDGTVMV